PFEPELYHRFARRVEFVGHPLLDRVRATRSREATLRAHGLDPEKPLVLLLPGSRAKEIHFLLPSLIEAVDELGAERQYALARASTIRSAEVAAEIARSRHPIAVIGDDTYNLIAAAGIALVASGTATLECALLECPMVIVYRTAALTFFLGRRLVRGV